MVQEKINSRKIYQKIVSGSQFLRSLKIAPIYFIIPILFSLGTAFFEWISLMLLAPVAKGLMEGDFLFIKETFWGRHAVSWFVQFFPLSNTSLGIALALAAFIGAAMKNVCQYGSVVSMAYQSEKFANNLKKMIFDRYMCFGKLFFDRNNFGYLNSVLLYFTSNVANMLSGFQEGLVHIFLMIAYLIVMARISWSLTLATTIVFPVLYFSLEWLIRRIKKASQQEAAVNVALGNKAANVLTCMPLVKAYSCEEKEKKQFSAMCDSLVDWRLSMIKKHSLVAPLQEIVSLLALWLLIFAISFVAFKGKGQHISGFLVFFVVVRRVVQSFSVLNGMKVLFARTKGSISELSKILGDQNKFFVLGGTKNFPGAKEKIEFCHLDFAYTPKIPVLSDVSFSVEKGKMTAIVGPTGSGKTTLVHLLLRFYDCKPGMIRIDGVDIREYTLESLRSHMAIVTQDHLLFDDTFRANIAYGLEGCAEEELIAVTKKARIYDFIMSLPDHFETLIGDKGVKLSGGEKQRVAIARALLKKTELLLLDEATSSLDTQTEQLIQEAIEEAVHDRTSLVIAHRLSTIRNANKIVVIEKGRFIEEGTLEELLCKKGKFFEYWEAQKFV